MKNKFKKLVVLDSVIFYPEHRALLKKFAKEIVEYPASIPDALEKQFTDNPKIFTNKKCYTQIATDDIPKQILADRVEGADVIISCWTDIPNEILEINRQLKLIVFWTHEKEHRIDMQLAKKLGIKVTNVPDYGSDSVTEAVFAGLEEVLLRNYTSQNTEKNDVELSHAILTHVFRHYRKLDKNEKYTRTGKFLHHFHKLGFVDWSFKKKELEQLIPEKLIANKPIGLLNISNSKTTMSTLKVFNVLVDNQKFTDDDAHLAEFYTFMAENELVFYDSKLLSKAIKQKIEVIFKDRVIDIATLESSNFKTVGKQFAIIGLGRIGKRVAKLAKAIGYSVVYYSDSMDKDFEKKTGIKYMNLKKLMATSDIVSLHVPAYEAVNLVNKELINSMKSGSIFINTADGNAIDQQALTDRMLTGEIYAYLDVYPGLPRKDIIGIEMKDKKDWKLKKILPNNVFAYRVGWKTQESIRIKTYKLLGEMVDYLINDKS